MVLNSSFKSFLVCTLLLFFTGAVAVPVPDSIAVHNPADQEQLAKYKQQAEAFCAKNLNRFGLSELQHYDAALDTFYRKELSDTLTAIKLNYQKTHQSRNYSLGTLNEQIKIQTVQKEDAEKRFKKLLKKAGVASLIWLAIVLILMQIRWRTLRSAQLALDNSASQLAVSSSNYNLGNELLQFSKSQKESIVAATTIEKELSEASIGTEAQASIKNIQAAVSLNKKLVTAIDAVEKAPVGETIEETEKTASNLNEICDQCMDAVYFGMKSKDETFNCTIAKDLEKNLPATKINIGAVDYLLLNVLNNAFQSVYEKYRRGAKGYVPKVTISTRVLPRFTQIRVKDNGDGMPDALIDRINEPFFSNRNPKESAGLGMYFAKRIISEMHKGEMKVESRANDGTDVYLKFFI